MVAPVVFSSGFKVAFVGKSLNFSHLICDSYQAKINRNFLICEPGGRGGGTGGTWVNFCWVCAAGLSEPLPHYSLFRGQFIEPILVTFGLM